MVGSRLYWVGHVQRMESGDEFEKSLKERLKRDKKGEIAIQREGER